MIHLNIRCAKETQGRSLSNRFFSEVLFVTETWFVMETVELCFTNCNNTQIFINIRVLLQNVVRE